MKPFILIGLILIILSFLVTGCTLTQKNVDIIAKQLQEKYDNINSYQAKVTYDDSVRLVQVKRPDKYKDILIDPSKGGQSFICDDNVKIEYDLYPPEANKFFNYDCTKDVKEFFNIMDLIKELANYENKISWDKLNGEEAIKVEITTEVTDSFGKDIGTQEITAWFNKENYQLLKVAMKVEPQSGIKPEQIEKPFVALYSGLELNKDIPNSEFELVIPPAITRICEIDALKGKEDYIKCQGQGIKQEEPPESRFSKNIDCENKYYRMAFILLTENPSEVTPDRLNKLINIKNDFSKYFAIATRNLASMDTSDDIYVMTVKNESIDFGFGEITKKIYEEHSDTYDFISIYTTFPTEGPQQSWDVVSNIKGIHNIDEGGEAAAPSLQGTRQFPIIDNSYTYGSSGKLKHINFMKDIDMYQSAPERAINGLLHETGHYWCCYVGDNFAQGQGGAKLEIIQQGIHFYRGLESPYDTGTAMMSDYWVPNNDGTFRRENKEGIQKYHPFQLYFMGLLPKEEYDIKYQIYDAGLPGNWNFEKAIPYKQVTVNDIIEVMGERECVLPIQEMQEEVPRPTEEAVRPTGGEPAPTQEVIS